jgi:hypothetical protein
VQDFTSSPVLEFLKAGQFRQAFAVTAELLGRYGVEISVDELARDFPDDLVKEQSNVTNI